MPADTNPNGDIFGGWIMSQMDIAGSILASQMSDGSVATVAVEAMSFIEPVRVGDVVYCYGKIDKLGKTSMTIHLEVYASPHNCSQKVQKHKVTEANFIYVAVDELGKKLPIHTEVNDL
ncbi:MAG: acyl-CoA thioesterase [Amphritea sp.]|nr:acyl-CoA thioesterase [Amphritea sp.]